MARVTLIAAAISFALAAPAFAGDGNHGGNWNHANHWNGGHWHGGWWNGRYWYWNPWGPAATAAGIIAGAAALGAVAAPYYGYGWGYPYGTYGVYGPYNGYGVGTGYGYQTPVPLHQPCYNQSGPC